MPSSTGATSAFDTAALVADADDETGSFSMTCVVRAVLASVVGDCERSTPGTRMTNASDRYFIVGPDRLCGRLKSEDSFTYAFRQRDVSKGLEVSV